MTIMKKQVIRWSLLAVLLITGSWQISSALNPAAPALANAATVASKDGATEILGPEVFSPQLVHAQTARAITQHLEHHYHKMPLNDELASDIFDQYLTDLDPNRVYFMQSDVDEFEPLRLKLDDELRNGNLTSGYKIFNRYQQRTREQLSRLVTMLERGIDELDFTLDDEVLLDRSESPWAATDREMAKIWEHRLKNAVLAMRLEDLEDEEITSRLLRRYRAQINRLAQNNNDDAFQVYINALAKNYDPHTSWFTPHNLDNFNINMSRSLEGIGAVLQAEDEYTKIVRLVPGGPAQKGGTLQPADRIVAVGQEQEEMVNVIGWRLDEVVNLIRGPKGTRVRLEVIPSGSASEHTTREVTIVRNKIVLEEQAARSEILDIPRGEASLRVGLVTIPTFYMDFEAYRRGDPNYTSTTRDVVKLIQSLTEQEIDGLIIDLRNNGGGSLQEATQLVSLFINRGPTVQVRDSRGRVQVEQNQIPGMIYGGPMMVMVNRFSASASEIFAGAMQDHGRALVVGDDTYGKATVQTLLPLKYGQFKMTTNKFYRVSGESNQHSGVLPDIALPAVINKEDIGESSLPNALSSDSISPARYEPVFDFSPYVPQLQALHEKRTEEHPEFVYMRKQRELLEERRQQKTASLNENTRRKDQSDWEQRRLLLENFIREARGLEPLETMEDLRAADAKAAAEAADDSARREFDPWLEESSHILADFIGLLRRERVAAGQAAAQR